MKIIAHRGASIEHPENSIEAIQKAFLHDVYAVEIDVHLSFDGVPVVIHDDTLQRTHNDARKVSEHLAKDLPIPTLEDVLKLERKCLLIIEMKEGPNDCQLVEKVTAVAKGHPKVVLASFSQKMLKEVKGFEILGLAETPSEIPPFEWVCLDHTIIDRALMKSLQGRKVWTYTLDDAQKAKELHDLGVEGFITNDPRNFLK